MVRSSCATAKRLGLTSHSLFAKEQQLRERYGMKLAVAATFQQKQSRSENDMDSKHWRQHGVPAYVYGCRPTNMAKADEQVEIEEYLRVVRTRVQTAAAYLDVR